MIYNLSQPNIEVNKRLEAVCFSAWLIFDWKTKQGFLSISLGSKVTVSEKFSTKFGYDPKRMRYLVRDEFMAPCWFYFNAYVIYYKIFVQDLSVDKLWW